jgi:hypothetical protein
MLERLLNHDGLQLNPPATQAEIELLERRLQTKLPDELLAVWRKSNGFGIPSVNADFLGISQILEFLENWDPKIQTGLLPILDTHSSNHIAFCYWEPLSPRIAYIVHDDNTRLLYRDFNRFLEVLLECLKQNAELEAAEDFDDYDNESIDADIFFHETQGDYGDQLPRTPEDQTVARSLLKMPTKQRDSWDTVWNHVFAIQLLDETSVATWQKLLEPGTGLRGEAIARMCHFSSPAIQSLLSQDKLAFDAFANLLILAIQKTPLQFEGYEQNHLKISGRSFVVARFFERRHIPNAIARATAWFEDMVAGQDPRNRPNHFFEDN